MAISSRSSASQFSSSTNRSWLRSGTGIPRWFWTDSYTARISSGSTARRGNARANPQMDSPCRSHAIAFIRRRSPQVAIHPRTTKPVRPAAIHVSRDPRYTNPAPHATRRRLARNVGQPERSAAFCLSTIACHRRLELMVSKLQRTLLGTSPSSTCLLPSETETRLATTPRSLNTKYFPDSSRIRRGHVPRLLPFTARNRAAARSGNSFHGRGDLCPPLRFLPW